MSETGNSSEVEQLLRILITINARALWHEEKVKEVITQSAKQIAAYNLCDGTLTQAQVAKKVGLDSGNFSRAVSRWVRAGVLFKIGDMREARLLHLFPVST